MNSITNEREPLLFPNLPHDLGNLPLDLFKVVQSSLNPMHTELFATVSKTWQANCSVIARDEFLLIKPFIDWLNLNLSENQQGTKSKLLACYDVTKRFKSIIKQIRAVLQELDYETLKQLEKLSVETKKPKFFKDCLHLAAVDNRLEKTFQEYDINPNIIAKNFMFECTSIELAREGYLYKSFEVADMITINNKRDFALEWISKELFRDRLFDQTKKILLKINDRGAKKNLIVKFVDILNKHNERELARNYMSMLFY